MGRLDGKTIVVTGAASGIGRATALRLAAEGATVACLDLAADAAEKTAAEIAEAGAQARAWPIDVSDEGSVATAVGEVLRELGTIDVLCNVAGIGRFAHSAELAKEEWDRIIAVNLTGTFLMCRAVLPELLEHGGAIVNTASSAGLFGQPYSAAYGASKGGVIILTKSLAYEYIKRGVRVNAVAPGGIQTPIHDSFGFPDGADGKLFYKLSSPMGFGQPEEVAGLFAYLASDEARYVTGAVFAIDGGITC
jgi:NAD(P)-dependent dehydrogenase (short-subunit alcohol dehydrogenase family)